MFIFQNFNLEYFLEYFAYGLLINFSHSFEKIFSSNLLGKEEWFFEKSLLLRISLLFSLLSFIFERNFYYLYLTEFRFENNDICEFQKKKKRIETFCTLKIVIRELKYLHHCFTRFVLKKYLKASFYFPNK